MDSIPTNAPAATELPDGVRIRLEPLDLSTIPAGWQVGAASPAEVQIATAGNRFLADRVELVEFEVQRTRHRQSGGIQSTVRVTSLEGQTATGQCWMNNPFPSPRRMVAPDRTHYKMSQAS
jgi:hypothetical protein